ncbi:hypothetical protein [Streptomyces sp. NPDC059398]|uniref:hypothetical protein n=1 Tax=Streptomyces sp. NPDC059398 TaxID=3346820 RepID=UPI0036B0F2C1
MAHRLTRHEVPVMVDFYGFCLQDADDTAVPVQWPEGFESVDFVSASPGRIDVRSAGHTHTADLIVEVWDNCPTLSLGWDISSEFEVSYQSGKVRVWAVAGGPMPYILDLAAEPLVWSARMYAAGRDEVARRAQEGVPHGVEKYLVQLWPAR